MSKCKVTIISKQLHDNYKILTPSDKPFDGYYGLQILSQKTRHMWWHDWTINGPVSKIDQYGLRMALSLAHATAGQITMKMLMEYADGNEHSWREISDKLFPGKGYGHDIDCWRSLSQRNMIAFSSKHAHNVKFYVITDFGREVLNAVKVNDPYFKAIRWFKVDEDEVFSELIKAELDGVEAYKDIQPETYVTLLEQLLNANSAMRKLGSAYRWMNNIINTMKKNYHFYEKFTAPEVKNWLESHNTSEVQAFCKCLAKIEKNYSKKSRNAA